MTVRAWCTYRIAFVATIMFATSSGLLHFARFGTGDILQMSVLALLSFILGYRAQHGYQRLVIGYLLVALFVLAWYIPGMIWFELLGLVFSLRTIVGQLRRAKTNKPGRFRAAVFLAFLAPLVAASVKRPKILLEVLGLPQSLHTLTHFLGNLWNIVLAITVHSNGRPLLWVGHAPLLTIVEVILGALGAYYIYREASQSDVHSCSDHWRLGWCWRQPRRCRHLRMPGAHPVSLHRDRNRPAARRMADRVSTKPYRPHGRRRHPLYHVGVFGYVPAARILRRLAKCARHSPGIRPPAP